MYIHQDKHWPTFTWDGKALSARLEAVHHLQEQMLGRMESFGFRLRAEATLQSLTEEVLKSSDIEGEILDKNQVRSSIARRMGMDIQGLIPADRNVEGIVEIMLDATQKYQTPLTAARLFDWHAALFPTARSGMHKMITGAWREDMSGPMQVISGALGHEKVHYEAPAAARVPEEMEAFLLWFNRYDGTDLVLRAGLAHLWFVTIHPFEDGNGRIARAIADMALARSEKTTQRFYSMSAQIRIERNDYYNMLETTQKAGLDITAWLDWFLACLGRAFEGAESTLAHVHKTARFWEQHKTTSFNERQKKVITLLLGYFEGKLTSSKWAKINKCSQDTAGRDIEDLITKTILKKDARGGRSTSYSLRDAT